MPTPALSAARLPCLLLGAVLTCWLLACQPQQPNDTTSQQISVVDYSGQTVQLQQPAQRIVALAPHAVENIFSAGAGDLLVGVMQYSNFPPESSALPIVGGYEKIDFERIIELQPDLIIVWETGNPRAGVDKLRTLGFPIYVDQPDTLSDVARSLRDIGVLSGRQATANQAADEYLQSLDTLRSRYAGQRKVSTFYEVWNSPLQTISGNHVINAAIELCGGENIFADEFAIAPVVSLEAVIERDPLVILASGSGAERPRWLDDWQQWSSMTAVQQGNLFHVNPDHIQRHSTRLLQGIDTVCSHLATARARAGEPDQ